MAHQSGKRIEVKIKLPDDMRGGVYANWMQATHTREEFCLDFISVFQGNGIVTARVVCSPGHLKRIVGALAENLKKYEGKFGTIKQENTHGNDAAIGFSSGE